MRHLACECNARISHAAVVPPNFGLPQRDIVALASNTSNLSTLVTAIVTANLVAALQVRSMCQKRPDREHPGHSSHIFSPPLCHLVLLQCTAQQCLPYTVFAPTNAAFAKLPASVLSGLLANPAQLAQVLKYHLLDHRVYSTQIANGAKVRPG